MDNEVQLITGVETEPAHRSDQDAPGPMIDQLEPHDRKPEILYADGQYGSDANVVHAGERGVDLQSLVAGAPQQNPDDLTIDDFVVGEKAQTVMDASHCWACPCQNPCPVKDDCPSLCRQRVMTVRRCSNRVAPADPETGRSVSARIGKGEQVPSRLLAEFTDLCQWGRRG